MKISIIMPAFNAAPYIRKAIDSVLLQPYADKELIVIDGGSTDGTVAILESYGDRISWLSEKDHGQADAINKGFRRAQGDVLAWLNADDAYAPDVFGTVVDAFEAHLDAVLVYGNCRSVSPSAASLNIPPRQVTAGMLVERGNFVFQPSSFYRASAVREIGFLDATLEYWMEYDLCIRLLKRGEGHYIDALLSEFTIREDQKSDRKNRAAMDREMVAISRKHGGSRVSRVQFAAWYHAGISFLSRT